MHGIVNVKGYTRLGLTPHKTHENHRWNSTTRRHFGNEFAYGTRGLIELLECSFHIENFSFKCDENIQQAGTGVITVGFR